MSKSKVLKPGQKAPASGIYEAVGPRGGRTGEQIDIVRGEPLPPTPNIAPIPKSAEGYTLRSKSGDYIIMSPAHSANTVMTWSQALIPPGTPAPRSGIYEQVSKRGKPVDATRGKSLPASEPGARGWTLVRAARHKSGK
jgi:hypothetical protein